MSKDFTLVKSSNPDVERAHLNRILARLFNLASSGGGGGTDAGGDIDGGNAFTVFTDTDPVLDGGGA